MVAVPQSVAYPSRAIKRSHHYRPVAMPVKCLRSGRYAECETNGEECRPLGAALSRSAHRIHRQSRLTPKLTTCQSIGYEHEQHRIDRMQRRDDVYLSANIDQGPLEDHEASEQQRTL
jgi:hypothetical protein